MKFNPMFGFIAATVLLFASSVSAHVDIAGIWYVHSVTGEHWLHQPQIRSWNFTISKSPEENKLKGLSIYVEDESNEKIVENFDAERNLEFGLESYRFFSLFENNKYSKVYVESTGKEMKWEIIDQEGYYYGILELRPEPAPGKVTVFADDNIEFDNINDDEKNEGDDNQLISEDKTDDGEGDYGDDYEDDEEDSENELDGDENQSED